MSSYEHERRAIEFETPDRLTCQFGSMGVNDTHMAHWNQFGSGGADKNETYGEWGFIWVRTEQDNIGQAKGHPLLHWTMVDGYA